ncbi:unnamed protein product, partial [Mesorhabditis spiculigera]
MGQEEADRFRLVSYSSLRQGIDPRIPLSIVWLFLMFILVTGLIFLTPLTTARHNPYDRLHEIHDWQQVPRDNIPTRYDLYFKFFLPYRPGVDFGRRNFTFDGFAKITFRCERPNQKILFHSIRQGNFLIQVFDEKQHEVKITDFYHNHTQEVLHIDVEDVLTLGATYTVQLNYTGIFLNANWTGVYAAPYQYYKEKHWMLTTHLQTVDARRMFPCLDVPEAKAKFQVQNLI